MSTALWTSPFFTAAPGSASWIDTTMMSPSRPYRFRVPPRTFTTRAPRSRSRLDLCRAGKLANALPVLGQNGSEPRDVAPLLADRNRVLELAHRIAEPKIEEFLGQLLDLHEDLFFIHVSNLLRF